VQKIRTVRDERVAKYQQEDRAIVRESEAYRAMIAAGYRFEATRNLRLAEEADKLGLTETAESYRAEAQKYQQKLTTAQ